MSDRTPEKLDVLIAGNLAWHIGVDRGEAGREEVKALPGNPTWNLLAFEQGRLWFGVKPVIEDGISKAAPIATEMMLRFFVAWLARALGIPLTLK